MPLYVTFTEHICKPYILILKNFEVSSPIKKGDFFVWMFKEIDIQKSLHNLQKYNKSYYVQTAWANILKNGNNNYQNCALSLRKFILNILGKEIKTLFNWSVSVSVYWVNRIKHTCYKLAKQGSRNQARLMSSPSLLVFCFWVCMKSTPSEGHTIQICLTY